MGDKKKYSKNLCVESSELGIMRLSIFSEPEKKSLLENGGFQSHVSLAGNV